MPGKFYEEFHVGMTFKHTLARTVTEMDNVLFSALTMNIQPLHINEDYASKTQYGQRIVNGIFTLGLVVGITVPDLTDGTIVGNLGYHEVRHPHPVFHGDTIYVESEVLEMRESKSNTERGIVRFKHIGRNQHGVIVIELERTALFFKRNSGSA
jgi:itaconyl-CoA hydratase